jgi:hypothetical protein
MSEHTSARQAPVEQSEEYIIRRFFSLLPFSWISVQGFLDLSREEIYIYKEHTTSRYVTCTILFWNLTNLANFRETFQIFRVSRRT